MKHQIFFFIISFFLIFSCTESPVKQEIKETGNLEVTVKLKHLDTPIIDAIVTLPNKGISLNTDINGKVLFKGIEIGSYDVEVTFSDREEMFTQNSNVKLNATSVLTFTLDLIDPIKPIDPELNVLLQEAYYKFGLSYIGYSKYWGDIGCDVLTINDGQISSISKLDTYTFDSNDKTIENIWINHYKAIRHTNLGIDAIKNSKFINESALNLTSTEAEFKLLRALLYFNLVKLYGNPVLVTSTNSDINNTTVVQDPIKTYKLIEEDLIFAENYLNSFTIKNRASVPAAQALLGKVYLQMAGFPLYETDKYQKALNQFNKLIGAFSLSPTYENVFNNSLNLNNSEVIFQINYNEDYTNITNDWNRYLWGPTETIEKDLFGLSQGDLINSYFNSPDLLKTPISFPLNIEDTRLFENIATFTISGVIKSNAESIENWRPNKFSTYYQKENSFHFPVLRYADVLLMLSESENAINGPTKKAYDAINEVRRRAYGNNKNDLVSGLNQEEFLDVLLKERLLELCYEGHRKDDLIRTKKLQDVIDAFNSKNPQHLKNFASHNYIFPIPELEIQLNPSVTQNDGYIK